jgi:serine/threonine protein kinase
MSTSDTPPVAMTPAKLGRFELRGVLGRGAQATVWLAYDPRLDRDVAVKLMRVDAEASRTRGGETPWLREARIVSRLNHPHIVTLFEADVHEQQPYLVFEFVDGCTLSEMLHARKTGLPVHDAVALMLGVLSALHAAHLAGVVHCDLKPSNILVDASGRARVMDFGIAARTRQRPGNAETVRSVVGSPGYMSPEAARCEPPSPATDVFAAALVLTEMLAGRAVVEERDPFRAVYRVAHEDLTLPPLSDEIDDRLRALLLRALARDRAQRTPSAAAFLDALQQWMAPALLATGIGQGTGALEFLLRRMRHKSNFPALSDSVAGILRVTGSDSENMDRVSAEILKDVALTNKLLRMVNTAIYVRAGGGNISTVSRAVALVGLSAVRNMALSLVLLEHMRDQLHANRMKEEFLRSLMGGTLARRLCANALEGEDAFIGALFMNLGRLLTMFYFPEEGHQVEQAMTRWAVPLGEEAASIQALGMSYEDLGLGVAQSWGLPQALQSHMRKPRGEPPATPPAEAEDRLRWAALAANEVATKLLHSDPALAASGVVAVTERFSGVLGVSVPDMHARVQEASEQLAQVADAIGLSFPAGSNGRRLLDARVAAGASPATALDLVLDALPATLPLR